MQCFAIISKETVSGIVSLHIGIDHVRGRTEAKEMKEAGVKKGIKAVKGIKINGHVLEGALLVDDPDVKRAYPDASGQLRHVRTFSQPGRLRSYLKKHPEGIILAGVGTFFFPEPVPVSSAMIRFDEAGSADIVVRERAEEIEKQLAAMETIRAAASEAVGIIHEEPVS